MISQVKEKTNNRCRDQNGIEETTKKKFVVWNIYNPEDDISSSVSYFFIGQYLFSCKWLQLALKDVHALASIICNDVEYSVPITWRIDNTDTHL